MDVRLTEESLQLHQRLRQVLGNHSFNLVKWCSKSRTWTGWKPFNERERWNLHLKKRKFSTGSFQVPTHQRVCSWHKQTQPGYPPDMDSTQTVRTHFTTTFWPTGKNSTCNNCHENENTRDMEKWTTLGRRTTWRPSTIRWGLDQ